MRRFFTVIMEAYLHFLDDDGWPIAGNIALSALTSMFPFLIFLTGLAGVFGSKDLADQAAALLLDTWPPQVAGPIAQEIHNVLTGSGGSLVTVGAALGLYFSSNGIEALRVGLNRAYQVKDRRPWWLLRIESIAYVIVGSFALLAFTFFIVLGPLIWATVLSYAPQLAPLERAVTLLRYVITTVFLTGALVIAHKWLPATTRSLRQIAPGVALTLVLSLGFGIAFGTYLSVYARNYVTTYAGLASVMIALVFLNILAAIFVFGGELNATIFRAGKPPEGA
jgi:membrane protein